MVHVNLLLVLMSCLAAVSAAKFWNTNISYATCDDVICSSVSPDDVTLFVGCNYKCIKTITTYRKYCDRVKVFYSRCRELLQKLLHLKEFYMIKSLERASRFLIHLESGNEAIQRDTFHS